MQVTETLSEGLKRELKVVIPAAELDASLDKRLAELKDRVQIKGFRRGKVPVSHLRRIYGRNVMAEIVQQKVDESSRQALEERKETPAFQPQITFPEDEKEIEQVMEGKADLAYSLAFEIVPDFALADFAKIKLTRFVPEIADAEVDEAVTRIAEQNRPFADKAEGAKAASGDRVTIDFVGKIDGEPFEGGSAEDAPLVLGSGQFIPGFEEQLEGVKAGDVTTVKVTFPEDYQATHLAGKEAAFAVTVKKLEEPGELKVDDEFAKMLGLESLDKLNDAVREQIVGELSRITREKLKRQLLDALDEQHRFDLPPTLVEQEFEQIFGQLRSEMEQRGQTFEDLGDDEETTRKNYRDIAERRVRLGLVLSAVAERNEIKVSDEEVNRALMDQARRFPGQERMVFEYYQKNPQALAQLRAPLFEEKVVDFLVELADVSDKKVSREELIEEEHHDHDHDHDHDHGHDHDHDHGKKAKKAPARKAAAKKPAKKDG